MSITNLNTNKSFGGWLKQYRHRAHTTSCDMRFSIYLPPQASKEKVPVLYWLSGLTCTDENFMQKAGAQRIASELGIAIVAPDTSPRGEEVPDDPDGAYDFGLGAGFYVNATERPWNQYYQMYDYVLCELPKVIEEHFPVTQIRSISGHSMGGHGALVIGLKNAERFRSISAFSPICHPMDCPWGQKALSHYLGNDRENWRHYDASELIKITESKLPILVSQGDKDEFLEQQLKPNALMEAAREVGYPLTVNREAGYDHSYYFISSFIEQHLEFHARYLLQES